MIRTLCINLVISPPPSPARLRWRCSERRRPQRHAGSAPRDSRVCDGTGMDPAARGWRPRRHAGWNAALGESKEVGDDGLGFLDDDGDGDRGGGDLDFIDLGTARTTSSLRFFSWNSNFVQNYVKITKCWMKFKLCSNFSNFFLN